MHRLSGNVARLHEEKPMAEHGLTISVPLRTPEDRRQAERFAAAMPVSVDGEQGTTQDLSTTGLSFHADHAYEPGTQVEVVIEYLLDGHQYPLRCQAEVVRSVPDADGFTIGARLAPQSQIAPVALGDEHAAENAARHLRSVD
jgi:hypothetical protein